MQCMYISRTVPIDCTLTSIVIITETSPGVVVAGTVGGTAREGKKSDQKKFQPM